MQSVRGTLANDNTKSGVLSSSATKTSTAQIMNALIVDDYEPEACGTITNKLTSTSAPAPISTDTENKIVLLHSTTTHSSASTTNISSAYGSPKNASLLALDISPSTTIATSNSTEQPAETDFIMLPGTLLPLEWRPLSNYVKASNNLSQSCHDIFKLQKKIRKNNKKPTSIFWLKQNKDQSSDTCVYGLEANHFGYFRLLCPSADLYSPKSVHALYDEKKQLVGVASKHIPGFVSIQDEPLLESDLVIDALQYVSIDELEKVDERARLERMDLKHKPDSKIICEIHKQISGVMKKIQITAADLKKFRIAKGLAYGTSISYIFREDDYHIGNGSKDGDRIDGDMLDWPINYRFKKSGLIDYTFRDPANRFPVSTRDIESLPILTDAQPFYWPTKPAPYLPDAVTAVLAKFGINVTKNGFRPKDIEVFKKLTTHPVYKHYKFKVFLKYILTTQDMYHNISQSHVKVENRIDPKNSLDAKNLIEAKNQLDTNNLIEELAANQGERIDKFKTALLNSPGFLNFLTHSGDAAVKEMIGEFADYNARFIKHMHRDARYKEQVVNLNSIVRNYVDFCARLKIIKNPDLFTTDPEIAELVTENKETLRRSLK